MQEQAPHSRHLKSRRNGGGEDVMHSNHNRSRKNGNKEDSTHSSRHKSRRTRKKEDSTHSSHQAVPSQDSRASRTPAASQHTPSLSSPSALFPPRENAPIYRSQDSWRANPIRTRHYTSSDDDSIETLESFDDEAATSPGACHVKGINSSHSIQGTVDSKYQSDQTFKVPVAEVVPDEVELVAEMKKRLERELKEELGTRILPKDHTPVVAEAVSTSEIQKLQRRIFGCIFLGVILIIVGTVTADVTMRTEYGGTPVCLGATPIQKGQTNISSWVNPATRPDELVYSSACPNQGIVSKPNAWFSLVGTGDVYAVSTCSSYLNFDSAISVGTGSLCDDVKCIAYADFQREECTESSYRAATVLFRTDVGVTYYIGVEGINNASQGNFTLSINTVVAPRNSDCPNSIVVKPGKSFEPGSITNATRDIDFNGSCADTAGLPSVWYSLVGTGGVFEISTCTSYLNFNSAISVSTGSCENLECLASSNHDPYGCLETDYVSSRVNFRSEVGVEYFLQVHPALNDSWQGEFVLVISNGPAPINDDCSSATIVEPGTGPVLGSLSHATWDTNMNNKCFGSLSTKLVWYSLIGTGDVYAISTCSSVLTFDSNITVLSGACDSLECMIPGIAIDYDCPETTYKAASIRLPTKIDMEYFIAVEGTNFTVPADFSIEISKVEPPQNDDCSFATNIQENGGPVYGTTMDATSSNVGSDSSADVWYRMVGNGTMAVASFCGYATTCDPIVEIYDGCDATSIVGTTSVEDFSCELQWEAAFGVAYYIRVARCDGGGQFELTVTWK